MKESAVLLSNTNVARIREQFLALTKAVNGRPAAFLDGPAGTQCPRVVIDAIANYLATCNANHGGLFATSRESDAMLAEARQACADLLGAKDSEEIVFGQNMTSLTFAFSRALAKTWKPGDEIVVTRLDHDANVTPWVLAALDAGATVKYVDFDPADGTLDLKQLKSLLSSRTKLAAIGCASNSLGTINPVAEITRWVHEAGGQVFLDAVHYAPHLLPDVAAWGCDYLACSAYKFFGPHVGILWGRKPLLESLTPYKVRPAPESVPDRWMTGTQNHECIAGVLAAIHYLAGLGHDLMGNAKPASRRAALQSAYGAIAAYEQGLVQKLIRGLSEIPGITVRGITNPARAAERMPTVSFTHARHSAATIATRLGEAGIFVWHGNYYALGITERLGLEPDGMVRIGFVHYNTEEEVERTLAELRSL